MHDACTWRARVRARSGFVNGSVSGARRLAGIRGERRRALHPRAPVGPWLNAPRSRVERWSRRAWRRPCGVRGSADALGGRRPRRGCLGSPRRWLSRRDPLRSALISALRHRHGWIALLVTDFLPARRPHRHDRDRLRRAGEDHRDDPSGDDASRAGTVRDGGRDRRSLEELGASAAKSSPRAATVVRRFGSSQTIRIYFRTRKMLTGNAAPRRSPCLRGPCPEVDVLLVGVAVDLGELVGGEVEVLDRADAVLDLGRGARRRSAPR